MTRIVPALLMVAALAVPPQRASAAEDPREVNARTHFAKGEYKQALEIFAVLFAEKNDPIFMRNIGRCYQKLRQPDNAIDSFREYLRRSPNLRASEKQEIEGFIREMEELRTSQAAVTPPSVTSPAASSVQPPPPTPVDLQPRTPAQTDSAPAIDVTATSPPPDARPPIYKRWWFWAGAGAVVAAAVVTGIALSAGSDTQVGNCMGFLDCVRVKN